MANTFKSYLTAGVTTQTTVHTAPAATQTAVIGLSLSNTGSNVAVVTVTLTRGSTVVSVVTNATVPAGDTLVLYGGDQKLAMVAGDLLKLTSNVSVDAIVSVLEIS
jgi:siroheme synthase